MRISWFIQLLRTTPTVFIRILETRGARPFLYFNRSDCADSARWKISVKQRARVGARIVALIYNIGNYDDVSADLPKLPSTVDGFYYTDEELAKQEREKIEAKGWVVMDAEVQEETPFISSDRITSKYLKWNLSERLSGYDFVVTHDANVRVDYRRVRRFIETNGGNSSVMFKSWPHKTKPGVPRVPRDGRHADESTPVRLTVQRQRAFLERKVATGHVVRSEAILRDERFHIPSTVRAIQGVWS